MDAGKSYCRTCAFHAPTGEEKCKLHWRTPCPDIMETNEDMEMIMQALQEGWVLRRDPFKGRWALWYSNNFRVRPVDGIAARKMLDRGLIELISRRMGREVYGLVGGRQDDK